MIPTSGKKIHMPACRSQGLTHSPALNPYQMRKGLDLDPAIEETEKSRKFCHKFAILSNTKAIYTIPKIVS